MSKRHMRCGARLVATLGLVWLLSGCVTASEPLYQGDTSREPRNLTAFEKGPVRMRIPAGYSTKPAPPNADDQFRAWLQKDGSSANIQIYCYGVFVSKAGLRLNLLKTTESVMPNALQIVKPQAFGKSNLAAVMEGYTGTVTARGQEIPMNIYLAWKLDTRIGGCKYGLFGVVAKKDADDFFPEFVAMVRTLQ